MQAPSHSMQWHASSPWRCPAVPSGNEPNACCWKRSPALTCHHILHARNFRVHATITLRCPPPLPAQRASATSGWRISATRATRIACCRRSTSARPSARACSSTQRPTARRKRRRREPAHLPGGPVRAGARCARSACLRALWRVEKCAALPCRCVQPCTDLHPCAALGLIVARRSLVSTPPCSVLGVCGRNDDGYCPPGRHAPQQWVNTGS